MEKEKMFQTTNQAYIYIVWMNHRISLTWTKAISLKKGSTTPGRSLRQHSTRAKSQMSQKQLATKEPFGSDPFHGQLCLIDSKLPSSLCHFLLSPNTVDTRSCRKSISLPAAHWLLKNVNHFRLKRKWRPFIEPLMKAMCHWFGDDSPIHSSSFQWRKTTGRSVEFIQINHPIKISFKKNCEIPWNPHTSSSSWSRKATNPSCWWSKVFELWLGIIRGNKKVMCTPLCHNQK